MSGAVLGLFMLVAAPVWARTHDAARGGPLKCGKVLITAVLRGVDFAIPAGCEQMTIPAPYDTRTGALGVEIWRGTRRLAIVPQTKPMPAPVPLSVTVRDVRQAFVLAPLGMPEQHRRRVGNLEIVELE